jgi:hypothetical protein
MKPRTETNEQCVFEMHIPCKHMHCVNIYMQTHDVTWTLLDALTRTRKGARPHDDKLFHSRWRPFVATTVISFRRYSRTGPIKVKADLSLCLTAQWRLVGSVCINPLFLDLYTSWKWAVSFTPPPLYTRRKSPRYPQDRRLGGHQRRSGRRGEHCWPYRDSNSNPSVVVYLTTLNDVDTFIGSDIHCDGFNDA